MVALDGTLIGKQGFITGGMSGNEAARASRWNDSALEGLRKVADSSRRNSLRGRLHLTALSRSPVALVAGCSVSP